VPTSAAHRSVTPICSGRLSNRSKMKTPAAVPRRIDRFVVICRIPLPMERSRDSRLSGSNPYLTGLKNALCKAIRKRAVISRAELPAPNAAMASDIASTSGNLVKKIIRPFSKRSARKPASGEKSRKGRGKRNWARLAKRTWDASSGRFDRRNRLRAILNALSLAAPRPWTRKNETKRGEDSRPLILLAGRSDCGIDASIINRNRTNQLMYSARGVSVRNRIRG